MFPEQGEEASLKISLTTDTLPTAIVVTFWVI